MKLGPLKSAIRAHQGSVKVNAKFPGGTAQLVGLVKSELLTALDAAYPGGRSAETGLALVDGVLDYERDDT